MMNLFEMAIFVFDMWTAMICGNQIGNRHVYQIVNITWCFKFGDQKKKIILLNFDKIRILINYHMIFIIDDYQSY